MSVLCWQPLIAALTGLEETLSRFSVRQVETGFMVKILPLHFKKKKKINKKKPAWSRYREMVWSAGAALSQRDPARDVQPFLVSCSHQNSEMLSLLCHPCV